MTPSEHTSRRTVTSDDVATSYDEREEFLMDEQPMDTFAAAMIADGEFELAGFEATQDNYVRAYQHLADTGTAWQLQGRIGREAQRLINEGFINGDPCRE